MDGDSLVTVVFNCSLLEEGPPRAMPSDRFSHQTSVFPKIGFSPKMDGENNGKPYKNGMIWGDPYFRKHPNQLSWKQLVHFQTSQYQTSIEFHLAYGNLFRTADCFMIFPMKGSWSYPACYLRLPTTEVTFFFLCWKKCRDAFQEHPTTQRKSTQLPINQPTCHGPPRTALTSMCRCKANHRFHAKPNLESAATRPQGWFPPKRKRWFMTLLPPFFGTVTSLMIWLGEIDR